MQDYILEMKDISKIYGNGIAANKDVDFNLKKGEIHAEWNRRPQEKSSCGGRT